MTFFANSEAYHRRGHAKGRKEMIELKRNVNMPEMSNEDEKSMPDTIANSINRKRNLTKEFE